MQIYQYLDTHAIDYQRHDHPPVFTCDDVNRLIPDLPGQKTKNLFVCDAKGRQHFLVTVTDEKSVDLKALAAELDVKKLRFASADRLERHLRLTPGSVTLLGVMNDTAGTVKVVIDTAVWQADALQCHPLINTATLVISRDHIRKFLEATGHTPTVLDVPERE
jgi:Ala-tRNA(Pro) deacylase